MSVSTRRVNAAGKKRTTFVLRTPRDLSEFISLNHAASEASIVEIARRADLCWMTVRNVIDGSTKEPRLTTALKLLRAFDYEVTIRRSGAVEARG